MKPSPKSAVSSQSVNLRTYSPGHSPSQTIPPPFTSHLHAPINSVKRYTVNVYKIDSCRSVRVRSRPTDKCQFKKTRWWSVGPGSRVVGRLGSGVWVPSFALSTEGKCTRREENCLGGRMSQGNVHVLCRRIQLERKNFRSCGNSFWRDFVYIILYIIGPRKNAVKQMPW